MAANGPTGSAVSIRAHVRLLAALALLLTPAAADVRDCACDVSVPESLQSRNCGLCREAEKQPAGATVFFLKDINPRKPNRWLALPRYHLKGPEPLSQMTPRQREEFWIAAIAKARELFGDGWGLAFNGDEARTQCHMHVHIGKLLDNVETREFVVVDSPAQIPVPRDGLGLWIHADGARLHVHLGEQITETVLMR